MTNILNDGGSHHTILWNSYSSYKLKTRSKKTNKKLKNKIKSKKILHVHITFRKKGPETREFFLSGLRKRFNDSHRISIIFFNSVISHWVNVTYLGCLLYYKLNTPTCTIRIPNYFLYYKITDSNIAKISKVKMYALQSTCIFSNVEFILSFGIDK